VPIALKQVIPWGRSFDEYRRMFDLSEQDLRGPILGCGDGPASFNAEASARGIRVVSCDPIYVFLSHQIEQRVNECYEDLIAQLKVDPHGFVWSDFRDPDDLGRCRLQAMRLFLADLPQGRAEGRYVAAALPNLPFADRSFDLALVSHLLFLYSEHLDLEFHRNSIAELLRVAREVRVFPLLTLRHVRSPHIASLVKRCKAMTWQAEFQTVPYEFLRGGNQMLRIRRQD
jgi:hypothetical protein